MSAATILADAYGESACLYTTVLGVERDASASQLRKAYYKKCLRYHPDKLSSDLSEDETAAAKKKFQAISLAYAILSDEEKRKEYDETGDLYDDDDELANKSGMEQWTKYFNNLFPKVTTADIEAFEVKYKCSDEEEADVLKYYAQFKGDLNKMLECVMLSAADVDKQRWVKDFIEPAIARGDVEDYASKIEQTLGSAPAKKRKAKGGGKKKRAEMEESESDSDSDIPVAEIVEDEEMGDAKPSAGAKENSSNKKAKKGDSSKKASATKKTSKAKASKPSKDDDLFAAIRGNALARREEGFDSMMAGLEERYGGGKKKKKGGKKKSDGDIDDDEFAKIQAKLLQKKGS